MNRRGFLKGLLGILALPFLQKPDAVEAIECKDVEPESASSPWDIWENQIEEPAVDLAETAQFEFIKDECARSVNERYKTFFSGFYVDDTYPDDGPIPAADRRPITINFDEPVEANFLRIPPDLMGKPFAEYTAPPNR